MHHLDAMRRYVAVKGMIKDLELELDELYPYIESVIDESGTNNFQFGNYGTFSLMSRTTYDYSDKVKEISEQVKLLKKQEEIEKIATVKNVSRSLTWRPKKDE